MSKPKDLTNQSNKSVIIFNLSELPKGFPTTTIESIKDRPFFIHDSCWVGKYDELHDPIIEEEKEAIDFLLSSIWSAFHDYDIWDIIDKQATIGVRRGHTCEQLEGFFRDQGFNIIYIKDLQKTLREVMENEYPYILDIISALKTGADIGEQTEDGDWVRCKEEGQTVLHHLVWSSDHAIWVQRCLDAGIPVDVTDVNGCTPLFFASESPESTKILLEAGANVNHTNKSGYSPLADLREDCEEQAHESVALMLAAGADPNLYNDSSRSIPLYNMVRSDHPKIVQLLLEAGAKPNVFVSFQGTPLHKAAEYGKLANTKLLLQHGADVLSKNYYGHTAADLARKERHFDVLDALAEAGGDPNASSRSLPENFPDPKTVTLTTLLQRLQPQPVDNETLEYLRTGDELDRALVAAVESNKLETYFEILCDRLEISNLSKGFCEYVEATLHISSIEGGAFELWGITEAHRHRRTWIELFGQLSDDFAEHQFPGFQIGHNAQGHTFWCIIKTVLAGDRNGWVLGLHEDEYEQIGQLEAAEMGGVSFEYCDEYIELLTDSWAPLDVIDLFFLNAVIQDSNQKDSSKAVSAVFYWDHAKLTKHLERGSIKYLAPSVKTVSN